MIKNDFVSIIRFNQILVTLRLLGFNKFDNTMRYFIWHCINNHTDPNSEIVEMILDGSYKNHP